MFCKVSTNKIQQRDIENVIKEGRRHLFEKLLLVMSKKRGTGFVSRN